MQRTSTALTLCRHRIHASPTSQYSVALHTAALHCCVYALHTLWQVEPACDQISGVRATTHNPCRIEPTTLEMLAVVYGSKTFRHYLQGNKFTLVTDHSPLTWLMNSRTLTGQHARWALCMQDFDFTIKHRPGVTHQNADTLSRFPLPTTEDGTGARMDEDEDEEEHTTGQASALLCRIGRTTTAITLSAHAPAFRASRRIIAAISSLQGEYPTSNMSDTSPTRDDLLGDSQPQHCPTGQPT